MAFSRTSTQNDQTDQQIAIYEKDAQSPLASAKAARLVTDDDYVAAGQAKVAIRKLRQGITSWFAGSVKDPGPKALAHRAWEKLCQEEKKLLDPLKEADDEYERKMLRFQQDKKARAAALSAAQEAVDRARAEDERLIQAVEMAEEAKATGDVALAQAADDYIDLPLEIMPTIVKPDVPKVAGIQTKNVLVVEIKDPRLMVLAIASGAMLEIVEATVGNRTADEQRFLVTFLQMFSPHRDGLVGIRYDKDKNPTGVGPADVNLSWIRNGATQKRDAFKLAGVVAEYRDTVV